MADEEPSSAPAAPTQAAAPLPEQPPVETPPQHSPSPSTGAEQPAAVAAQPERNVSPSASDAKAQGTPHERMGSLVLRPVAQRLSGGGPEASSGPLSPSSSLAEPGSGGQPIGWAPRKSAWSPYRPTAGSLPLPQVPRPGNDPAPEPAAAAAAAVAAGGAGGSSPKPTQPPPASLPAQNSLEMLHDAAVSAAEGFRAPRQESPGARAEATPPEEEALPRGEAGSEEQDPDHRFFTGTRTLFLFAVVCTSLFTPSPAAGSEGVAFFRRTDVSFWCNSMETHLVIML